MLRQCSSSLSFPNRLFNWPVILFSLYRSKSDLSSNTRLCVCHIMIYQGGGRGGGDAMTHNDSVFSSSTKSPKQTCHSDFLFNKWANRMQHFKVYPREMEAKTGLTDKTIRACTQRRFFPDTHTPSAHILEIWPDISLCHMRHWVR